MTEQYIQDLIRKYASGVATTEEVKILMDWYRQFNIEQVPWPSEDDSEKSMVSERMLGRLRKDISTRKIRVINFSWAKVAAVLFILFGVTTISVYVLKRTGSSYITVANPSGRIQLVDLPDSSKVWLNAATVLRYKESFENNRTLELDGEAYFEVTHDKGHPFKVNAGGIQTTVLGTRFNIDAYESKEIIKVSVISGKVKVEDHSEELAVLMPSRQLQYNKRRLVANTNTIDTTSILAWKSGYLKFEGEMLLDIAPSVENWYGIRIVFANASISKCRYYLNIDQSVPVEKFLSLMAEITELDYVFDKSTRTVTFSGKGCQ